MDKIYIIATNWRDCDIEMYQFYNPDKAVKYISELATEDGFRKADPTDDPQDYLSEYHSYLREEDVYNHKYNIALHIIDLKKEVSHG